MKKMMSHGISGLPDGLFSTPPPRFGKFWRVYEWPFGKLFGHLLYFKEICYILWTYNICSDQLVNPTYILAIKLSLQIIKPT
jgi:hypothetical protein